VNKIIEIECEQCKLLLNENGKLKRGQEILKSMIKNRELDKRKRDGELLDVADRVESLLEYKDFQDDEIKDIINKLRG